MIYLVKSNNIYLPTFLLQLLHECTVLNILETVMYHKEACESADDLIIDLMDYCYKKLTALIARLI